MDAGINWNMIGNGGFGDPNAPMGVSDQKTIYTSPGGLPNISVNPAELLNRVAMISGMTPQQQLAVDPTLAGAYTQYGAQTWNNNQRAGIMADNMAKQNGYQQQAVAGLNGMTGAYSALPQTAGIDAARHTATLNGATVPATGGGPGGGAGFMAMPGATGMAGAFAQHVGDQSGQRSATQAQNLGQLGGITQAFSQAGNQAERAGEGITQAGNFSQGQQSTVAPAFQSANAQAANYAGAGQMMGQAGQLGQMAKLFAGSPMPSAQQMRQWAQPVGSTDPYLKFMN